MEHDVESETQEQQGAAAAAGESPVSPEQFLEKLRTALQRDGDFPASAKIVSELRRLISDPKTTANQVAEVILREPSLGTRVLHVVNSSFYRRAKPIMTISQAVIQIGMKPLAELCSGLVLLQKFGGIAGKGRAFANCLTQTIVTSLLSGSLAQRGGAGAPNSANEEAGYLSGSLAELGTLLLAYYFPELYESAAARAASKNQSISRSISEIVGLSPLELSAEIIGALDLPDFYREVILQSQDAKKPEASNKGDPKKGAVLGEKEQIERAARYLSGAKQISEAITSGRGKHELDQVLANVTDGLKIDTKLVYQVVGELPAIFKHHCASVDLHLGSLPDFVAAYSEPENGAKPLPKEEQGDRFMQFVEEIRAAVQANEPAASIITTVMETFAWGLGFDRVLLLLVSPGKKSLVGRMVLGQMPNFDPRKFERPLGAGTGGPDCTAFRESRPVFRGEPVLEGGWPFAAIPVGFSTRAIGVVYADRQGKGDGELTPREQAAIGMLAELLDRALNAGG